MAKLSAKDLKNRIVGGQIDDAVKMIGARLDEAAPPERDTIAGRLGAVVQEAYDDYAYGHVDRLIEQARQQIDARTAEIFEDSVAECKKLTKTYHHKFLPLESERNARQLREALRSRDISEALRVLRDMLAAYTDDPTYGRRLNYIGSVVGSLVNDQQEVHQLLSRARSQASKYGWKPEDIDKIEAIFKDRINGMGKDEVINQEREFKAALTRVVVEMRSLLPDVNMVGDVSNAQIRKFSSAIRAMIRTTFLQKRPISWADLCDIFVEFVPAKVSATSALSGVEGRLYYRLGPAAQKTAKRVFQQTGELEVVRTALLHYAKQITDPKDMGRVAETMGLLAHPDFAQFLRQRLSDRRFQSIRGLMTSAIGQFGSAESGKALVEELRGHIRSAPTDRKARNLALKTIQALSESIKSAQTADEIAEILNQTIPLLPDKDNRMALDFALQMLPDAPADKLLPEHRSWFITTLTESLWLGEYTPEFAGGDDMQRTVLGWREPIVDAVVAFGNKGATDFMRAAHKQIGHFSGAFMAIAEICGRIGNHAFMPLLETALRVATQSNASAISRYSQETYYDSSEGVRKPISQRMILSALIIGISQVGGQRADFVLKDLNQKIQSNFCPSPDAEASRRIFESIKRLGGGGIGVEGESNGAGFADLAAITSQSGESAGAAGGNGPVDAKAVEQAVAAMNKFYFRASKKRAAKIAAIQVLASARAIDGIEPLLDAFDDKDPFIEASAQNALLEYGAPGTAPKILQAFVNRVVERMDQAQSEEREELANLLEQLNPSRPEMQKLLLQEMERVPSATPVYRALADLVNPTQSRQGPAIHREEEGNEAMVNATLSRAEILEKRREYLALRQAWIQGGKKGAAPARPPGI